MSTHNYCSRRGGKLERSRGSAYVLVENSETKNLGRSAVEDRAAKRAAALEWTKEISPSPGPCATLRQFCAVQLG